MNRPKTRCRIAPETHGRVEVTLIASVIQSLRHLFLAKENVRLFLHNSRVRLIPDSFYAKLADIIR
jgi:hypothetical protein